MRDDLRMSDGTPDERRFEFWSRRFVQYDTEARNQLHKATQLVTLGLTVLSGAAAAFVAYKRFDILMAVPVAVLILWAVGSRMLNEHMYLAAYRDHAEERMARIAGVEVPGFSVWHSLGGQAIASGRANFAFYGVLALISAGLLTAPFIIAAIFVPTYAGWVIGLAAAVLSLTAVVIAGVAANQRETAATYRRLHEELPTDPTG